MEPLLKLPSWQPSTVLSVDRYLALLRGLPLPTPEQRQNFVAYVTCAHSWYKHLPAFLPGAPFYFYLDRSAGCNWVPLPDGSYVITERKKQGFHYSDIPTAEYRTRFGYLDYSCAEGTAVFAVGGPLALPRDKAVALPGEDARPCYLPEPILEAGRVELTAVIHPHFAAYPLSALRSLVANRSVHWPTESGGRRTLKNIVKRLAAMATPEYETEKRERLRADSKDRKAGATRREKVGVSFESGWEHDPFQDPVLRELLKPERQRQKAEMLKAIDRVCMLVHGTGSTPGASG